MTHRTGMLAPPWNRSWLIFLCFLTMTYSTATRALGGYRMAWGCCGVVPSRATRAHSRLKSKIIVASWGVDDIVKNILWRIDAKRKHLVGASVSANTSRYRIPSRRLETRIFCVGNGQNSLPNGPALPSLIEGKLLKKQRPSAPETEISIYYRIELVALKSTAFAELVLGFHLRSEGRPGVYGANREDF